MTCMRSCNLHHRGWSTNWR